MSLGLPLGPYVSKDKKTPAENGNPFLDVGFVIFAALGVLIPLAVVVWGFFVCGV